jgi:NitT/TauT family transport system substrate-binding protein
MTKEKPMSRTWQAFCAAMAALPAAWIVAPALAQSKPPPAAIRVVPIPIANFTPVLVARDKGYFGEENLQVSWSPVAQGAVAIEAVFGGSAEVGGSAVLETMVARGNGLDLMFLAPGTRIRSQPPDNSALLVRSDEGIRAPTDLAGKKIAAGLINSVNYVHMLEWLQKKGVDRSKIEFLEVPFPQMADALFQKRVDAVWNVEPFVTFMTKSGKGRVLAYPYQETIPGMEVANYLAKESWIKANMDVARRFRRAIDRATAFMANAAKEERDEWVSKFTGMKLDVVKEVTLPVFSTEFNIPSLQANLEIAVRHQLVKQPFDVNVMIFKP